MPTETRAIAVPGGQLHAVADGEGSPILLVHAGMEAPEQLAGLIVDLVRPIGTWA